MKTRIIFLRHADTQKDPNLASKDWMLSDVGIVQAELLSKEPEFSKVFGSVSKVYVSSEAKTLLTVQPLLSRLGLEAEIISDFDEVRRGDKFLSKEDFELEKKKQLLELDYQAFGGESAQDALKRFLNKLLEVDSLHVGKTILVVSHGTILNLYFAKLLGVSSEDLCERWTRTGFGVYGIVEDGVVVKDIVDIC